MSGGTALQPRPVTVTRDQYQFRVKPGLFRVAASYGESPYARLKNETGFPVEFHFPVDLLLRDGKPVTYPLAVPDQGEVDVVVLTNQVKVVPYEVRVMLHPPIYVEAVGGSSPEVEVKP
jgi:hypothetical protein